MSRRWLRLKAAKLNRCQLYYIIKLPKLIFSIKVLKQSCVTYSYACRNIVNTIMTNGHSSLEKDTSHTLFEMVEKGLCVGGELETEQSCNILTPSSSGYSSTSFSFSWAALPGALRAESPQSGAGSHAGILSWKLWLKLTELPVAPGYIIVWHPPASCGSHICTQLNPFTAKVIPFDPMYQLFSTGAFLIWQLGRVGGQYVTAVVLFSLGRQFYRSTL